MRFAFIGAAAVLAIRRIAGAFRSACAAIFDGIECRACVIAALLALFAEVVAAFDDALSGVIANHSLGAVAWNLDLACSGFTSDAFVATDAARAAMVWIVGGVDAYGVATEFIGACTLGIAG